MVSRLQKFAVSALSLTMLFGGVVTAARAQEPNAAESSLTLLSAGEGAAFAMSNRTNGNQIVTYRRAANGALTRVGTVSTRGNGIGTDLDTQGALRLSSDHRFLYAANAGSDDVTVFAVNGTKLTFLQKIYAGDVPNSLTMRGNLLYVLVGSVAGNGILGFKRAGNGTLTPLADSFRDLSSPIAVPGQIEFSPDGRLLLVTQKTTNELLPPPNAIDVFTVDSAGFASAVPNRNASHGVRPFSMAFRDNDDLLVVEAFNAAPEASALSSYKVASDASLDVISGSVPNQQTDACWIVITEDGRNAFVANFGSGTISSYAIDSAGAISLVDGDAAFTGLTSQPVDLALSVDSQYLYLLLRGTGGVASFKIDDNGALSPLGIVTGGLPVADGASGLAVY